LVEEAVRQVLGQRRVDAYSAKRALRDMGLDSLDLVQLRHLLVERLGKPIDSTFFFRCNSLAE
jgi:acyl carrier protein